MICRDGAPGPEFLSEWRLTLVQKNRVFQLDHIPPHGTGCPKFDDSRFVPMASIAYLNSSPPQRVPGKGDAAFTVILVGIPQPPAS